MVKTDIIFSPASAYFFDSVANYYCRLKFAEKRVTMKEKKYETDCEKCSTPIKGVNCDVKNCAYHNGTCDCMAGKIYVGPSEAKNSTGTLCATFKAKEY